MDTVVLGKHNSRLADIRRAIERGMLTSDGLLPIEGLKLIREAEASGLAIAALFLRQGTPMEKHVLGIPVYMLEPAVFKGIQGTETSQGMVALVRPRVFGIEDVISNARSGPVVVLAGLQDPGNVGTIFRIAESFGAAGCLALSDTASAYNAKTVRASSGSLFRLPHVWNLTLEDVAGKLRAAGIPLLGTSPRANRSIEDWDWRRSTAVLIGNEGSGLGDHQIASCETMLRIPQRSQMESLNSAIAVAVILYEAFRSRGVS